MGAAAVALVERRTLGARRTRPDRTPETHRRAGAGPAAGRRRIHLVCDPSQAALRHLRGHGARADRIQRQRHRVDQAADDRVQRVGRAAEADQERGDRPASSCRRRSPGTWFWTSDKELQFTPKNDWPVDGAFSRAARRRRSCVAPAGPARELHASSSAASRSPASITESQFYQDPRDPNLKKLVATVTFSHPVDAEQFESRVSLAVAQGRRVSGPDAGQPPLHRRLRQVQAAAPTSTPRRWPCRATTRR